jgi:esterase
VILQAVQAGEGPAVVLLHGLFGSARNFGAVQKALAADYSVIALDLRNHGASPHAAGMDYAAMAADVLETLSELRVLPAVVIGHSMGGKVAMRVALERPDAVSALVVADIAPVPYRAHLRPIAAALAALELRPGLTRAEADTALSEAIPDRAMRGFLLQNLVPGPHPAWRIGLAEIVAGMAEIEAWPATGRTYSGPALFIAGERSDYIRPEHRPAIRALFPRARFVTLKDAGHWLHADNPAGFVSILQAFLASVRRGS